MLADIEKDYAAKRAVLDAEFAEKRRPIVAEIRAKFIKVLEEAAEIYRTLPEQDRQGVYQHEGYDEPGLFINALQILDLEPAKSLGNAPAPAPEPAPKASKPKNSWIDPAKPKATNEQILAFIKDKGPVSKTEVAKFANISGVTLNQRLEQPELKDKIDSKDKGVSTLLTVK